MPFALPGQDIVWRAGRRVVAPGSIGFTPGDLGASLYDMWDAEDASKLTLVGSAVSAWASSKNGYSAAQAVGAGRPVYSATSFNGRPGLTFDGSDDELTYAGVGVFPVGAAACEIWALVDQTALPANPDTRCAFAYGGDVGGVSRRLFRTVNGGLNRAQGLVGLGGTSSVSVTDVSVDFSGRHVARMQATGSQVSISVDGQSPVSLPVVPSTTSIRTRIGSNNFSTAQAFFQGVISLVAVTAPLSTDQATQMLAYLKARGGIA